MRTLATSPKFDSSGFTLIEVMVVLVIVGLMASVLSPAMQRVANSIQARSEFLEVKRKIQGLSTIAMQRGEAVDVVDLELKEGWIASGDVVYQPNGVCLGGDIRIAYKDVEFHRQELMPPFCRLGDADDE